jgi:hypothetical protein
VGGLSNGTNHKNFSLITGQETNTTEHFPLCRNLPLPGNGWKKPDSKHRQNSMSNAATAQKTNGKSATEEKAVMEVVKTESSNSAKTAENAILSLEKRIQKVQELNIVIDKWRKLQEARKNLNEFKLGNDGMSSTIIIRDAAGREFKTSQSIVFTTVLQTVQQVLDEKIAETEVQIDFAS